MKKIRLLGLCALLGAALVFPLLFSNPAIIAVAFFTCVYASAALAWNIFSGYTGYISFGQASFWGFGAYTFALLCKNWHIQGDYSTFLLLIPSGLVAGLAALPLGWIALRTRQHIFVVVTIAILFILQLIVSNLPFLANGQDGLYTPVPNWSNDFFNYPFYYVALTLLLLACAVSWWIRHSKFGLGLLAMRDDEDRALGLGVKIKAYKLGAYCLSAVFLGMAGALFFYFLGSIVQPAGAFDPSLDITLALMVFLGGIGTVAGPLLGALIMVPIEQYLLIQINTPGLELILYGALFLLILFFLPNGIIPSLQALWKKYQLWRARQEEHPSEQM